MSLNDSTSRIVSSKQISTFLKLKPTDRKRFEALRYLRGSCFKLFTPCIRQGLMSRDAIVDGDWLPATATCPKMWEYVPCTDYTGRGNILELVPTVQIETRYP